MEGQALQAQQLQDPEETGVLTQAAAAGVVAIQVLVVLVAAAAPVL
jgi:hypothetical protein